MLLQPVPPVGTLCLVDLPLFLTDSVDLYFPSFAVLCPLPWRGYGERGAFRSRSRLLTEGQASCLSPSTQSRCGLCLRFPPGSRTVRANDGRVAYSSVLLRRLEDLCILHPRKAIIFLAYAPADFNLSRHFHPMHLKESCSATAHPTCLLLYLWAPIQFLCISLVDGAHTLCPLTFLAHSLVLWQPRSAAASTVSKSQTVPCQFSSLAQYPSWLPRKTPLAPISQLS